MIFRRRRQQPKGEGAAPRPRVPAGQIVYAVGDLHGRLDLLARAADAIARDRARAPGADAVTIFIGDYIDRGPASRGVLDRLASQPFPTPIVPLIGNHEIMLLDFLKDAATLQSWRAVGGLETLFSYGVDVREALAGRGYERAHTQFQAALPAAHEAFLRGLRLCAEVGDYYFCHAGVRPGVPLAEQRAEDLVWIRDTFLASEADHGKVIVHGHTPVAAPTFKPNHINIDTGAFATGRLTCLRLEGDTQSILPL